MPQIVLDIGGFFGIFWETDKGFRQSLEGEWDGLDLSRAPVSSEIKKKKQKKTFRTDNLKRK
jgi:hypothetical protein